MDSVVALVSWGLATLIGAFAGSFLGAYMKKKGENLATHEDIDKLLDQVRAVTTATNEIEAKISSDVWDRQERWELRRDALFELMKRLGTLKDTLTALVSAHQTDLHNGLQDDLNRTAHRIKIGQEWIDAAASLDNAILTVGIVCGRELYVYLLKFSAAMRAIGMKAKEWDTKTLEAGMGAFGRDLAAVMDVVRKELDHDEH